MIDLAKKYKTRDGRDVIIHAIDGPEKNYPIIASVLNNTGKGKIWSLQTCTKTGRFIEEQTCGSDLVEVYPEYWVNVFWSKRQVTDLNNARQFWSHLTHGNHYSTKIEAMLNAGNEGQSAIYVATIRLPDKYFVIVQDQETLKPL